MPTSCSWRAVFVVCVCVFVRVNFTALWEMELRCVLTASCRQTSSAYLFIHVIFHERVNENIYINQPDT